MKKAVNKIAMLFCSAGLLSAAGTLSAMTDNSAQQISVLNQRIAQQETLLQQQSASLRTLKRQVLAISRSGRPAARSKSKAAVSFLPTSLFAWKYGDVSAKLSGQINMAGMLSDDGYSRDLFFVTNSNSNNRLKLTTTVQPTDDFSVGSIIEFGFKVNSGSSVSQTNKSGSSSTDFRKFDIVFNWKKLGKVSLGKGDTASNESAESDLSGTDVASYSSLDENGASLYFRKTNEVKGSLYTSNPTIGDVFESLDGLSRKTRVRYDTPTFYGFSLATSYMTDYIYDFALHYLNTFPWFKIQGAVAYTSSHASISSATGTMKGRQIDGSVSVLLNSGFNVSYAAGRFWTGTTGRQDPFFHFVKLGYIAKWFAMGSTALSVNYNFHRHFDVNTDRAKSYGAEMVQKLTRYNTELYANWQKFRLTRINDRYKPISMILVGARYKFG